MSLQINPDFEKWAMGFSGCDGGNLNGSIWFCGIEWGGGSEEDWLKDSVSKFEYVIEPYSINDEDIEERKKELIPQYNAKLLKMYSVLLGKEAKDYKETALAYKYLGKNGHIFKMNLYPIAFGDTKDDLWDFHHYKLTGFPTKTTYKAWCQINRFNKIREWLQENKPKAIICTGVTLHKEFLMAFCGFENIHEEVKKLEKIIIDDRYFYWMAINNNQSFLFIIPFFGNPYGLNKDEQIINIGKKIREICVINYGEKWLE
ncbi:MAG: hypothetical protein IPN42_06060 [Methylococcaceae bacterium]|nr:hypothetical protein [Methylococcaceae bacterium]